MSQPPRSFHQHHNLGRAGLKPAGVFTMSIVQVKRRRASHHAPPVHSWLQPAKLPWLRRPNWLIGLRTGLNDRYPVSKWGNRRWPIRHQNAAGGHRLAPAAKDAYQTEGWLDHSEFHSVSFIYLFATAHTEVVLPLCGWQIGKAD